MTRAEDAFSSNNYDKALSILEGISKNSQSYESFKLKGDVYYENGNFKDAMECYEVAVQLNNASVIENLVQLYFLSGNIDLALSMIEKIQSNNIKLTLEDRKIQYVCLYRQKRLEEAEIILNEYLPELNNHEVIKLRILSYDESTTTVVSMLTEMYESDDLDYLEQLIDLCYSYGSFNSNFLSLLNNIYNDNSANYDFRAKCAFYISSIFKSINNTGQMLYYGNIFDNMTRSIDVSIPNQMWQ
jgi:tetratricopeptide (TPR) repeat protein